MLRVLVVLNPAPWLLVYSNKGYCCCCCCSCVMQLVADYIGASGQFVPAVLRPIHWGGGRTVPPAGLPRCGFDGSGCVEGRAEFLVVARYMNIPSGYGSAPDP